MVCTVSSDWIKLAGQKLDRDLHHITVAHLYPMCMYCLHNSVMWLIIQKKNLFGYGMLWASNFSEVFWSGKVFYLIIKSCIDNFTMQHWSGCSIHIISNKEVPYWHVKLIILTLTCLSVVLFELFCCHWCDNVVWSGCVCSMHEITSMPHAFWSNLR